MSTPNPMQEIETACKAFAGARNELAERIQRLLDEQEQIKRRLMQGIRNAVGRFRSTYDGLHALVVEHPELFVKPKTQTLHGIRVGYMKQRGKLEIADADQVIALIRKHLPDQADVLIRTTEAPNRPALAELAAKDLKRIGVGVTEDTEAPFVKPVDGDVSKLIDALLSDKDLQELAP